MTGRSARRLRLLAFALPLLAVLLPGYAAVARGDAVPVPSAEAAVITLSTRAAFPVIWRAEDGVILRFHGLLSLWSDALWYWALDFHPADADTWAWLGQ